MPDIKVMPRLALAGVMPAGRHGKPQGPAGVVVAERSNLAFSSIIARKGQTQDLCALVRGAYGIDLPTSLRRAFVAMSNGRQVAFIWSGPEQWLAVSDSIENFEHELVGALGSRSMIANQGDGRCLLRISGLRAREVLAKGVTIDLHPRAFKTDNVAITQVAHMGVILWQVDETPSYEIAVFRSFAESLWSWLLASAAEFGCEVQETAC